MTTDQHQQMKWLKMLLSPARSSIFSLSPTPALSLLLAVMRSGFTKPVGTGPVPVWAGTRPAQIQNLNLNSKK